MLSIFRSEGFHRPHSARLRRISQEVVTGGTPLRAVGRSGRHPRFPALDQPFGACFHQDRPVEHARAADVLDVAIDDATSEDVRAVRRELASLPDSPHSDSDLRRLADELGLDYVREADGLRMREWLEYVLERVDAEQETRRG